MVLFFIGMSETEQTLKGTSQIKILTLEETEGMRIVCKVNPALYFGVIMHVGVSD